MFKKDLYKLKPKTDCLYIVASTEALLPFALVTVERMIVAGTKLLEVDWL